MWAGIKAFLVAVGAALGIVEKQQDANAAAVQKQAGADATTAAGLATVNKTQAEQAKAMVDAPSDVAGVADLARKGGL